MCSFITFNRLEKKLRTSAHALNYIKCTSTRAVHVQHVCCTCNSFAGKANLRYTAKYMFPVVGKCFCKQSSDFDKQKGFSSEKCVVDYENAVYSALTK